MSEDISWAAYHFSRQSFDFNKLHADISALLPLFRDDSKSSAIIKHAMYIIKEDVNNSQNPVIAFDQPLYALAKQIQWSWPEEYGEKAYVVMMGGLHVEMVTLKIIGNWLECN